MSVVFLSTLEYNTLARSRAKMEFGNMFLNTNVAFCDTCMLEYESSLCCQDMIFSSALTVTERLAGNLMVA